MRSSHPGTHSDPDIIRGKYCWRDAALCDCSTPLIGSLAPKSFWIAGLSFQPQTVLSLSLQLVSTPPLRTGRYQILEKAKTKKPGLRSFHRPLGVFQIWSEVKRARRGGVLGRKECCLGECSSWKNVNLLYWIMNCLDVYLIARLHKEENVIQLNLLLLPTWKGERWRERWELERRERKEREGTEEREETEREQRKESEEKETQREEMERKREKEEGDAQRPREREDT